MPKVSVVTTVYNGRPYFERALPSILAQTYSDFEYLIVDDGSTDGTGEKLAEVAQQDARIRILSPGRLGFAAALNHAIARAEGEYIARQDFDDISYPQRLARQVSYLDAHPDVGLVGGQYIREDEQRGERYVRLPPIENREIRAALVRYIPFAHTLVMFRRAAWEQVGGYPTATNLVDLRLWLRLAEAGWGFHNIPEVLGEHLIHGASFWHRTFTYRQRQRDFAWVQLEAIRRLHLPWWMVVYPLGRLTYSYLPDHVKRWTRRSLAGVQEQDVAEQQS